jgi:hypothetical protein
MNLAYPVTFSRVVQNPFRRRGFPGVDMGHDSNVSKLAQIAAHRYSIRPGAHGALY